MDNRKRNSSITKCNIPGSKKNNTRTLTIKMSYAATSSKTKRKILNTFGIQTDYPNNSNLQSLNYKIQSQTSNKHSNKQKETAPEILNLPKPSTPRLLLHKKSAEISSNKKKPK